MDVQPPDSIFGEPFQGLLADKFVVHAFNVSKKRSCSRVVKSWAMLLFSGIVFRHAASVLPNRALRGLYPIPLLLAVGS